MTYGVNAPLGLQATIYGGSSPWNGSFQHFPITTAYATSLFLGDPVSMTNSQLIRYATGNQATVPALGVFWGCTYTDTNGVVQFSKYWPASTVVKTGTVAVANVITDTNTFFTIQSNAAFAYANLTKNFNFSFATAGSTLTGESGAQLDYSSAAVTNTLPLHAIAFDTIPGNNPGLGNTSAAYANIIVKLNDSFFGNLSLGV